MAEQLGIAEDGGMSSRSRKLRHRDLSKLSVSVAPAWQRIWLGLWRLPMRQSLEHLD